MFVSARVFPLRLARSLQRGLLVIGAALVPAAGSLEAAPPAGAAAAREKREGVVARPTLEDWDELIGRELSAGNFDQAERAYEQAIELAEKTRGPDSMELAWFLTKLAELRRNRDKAAAARPLYERVLRIYEKQGMNSAARATGLLNLASGLKAQGEKEQAKRNVERALEILRQQPDPESPETARALVSLSVLSGERGEFSRAEELAVEAVRIVSRKAGPDDRRTFGAIHNLAQVHLGAGHLRRAAEIIEPALETQTALLDPLDPYLLSARNTLGDILAGLGDYQRAGALYRVALELAEKRYGPDSLELASTLDLLGDFSLKAGDYRRAEEAFRRALSIRESELPANHEDTAESLNKLGMFFFNVRDFVPAEKHYRRALAIKERIFGRNDTRTAIVLDNLANVLQSTNRAKEADPLYRRAHGILEKHLGPQHTDTLLCTSNWAANQFALGNYRDAEKLLRQTVAAYRERPDAGSADGLLPAYNLGRFLRMHGKPDEAERELRRVREAATKNFGRAHPLATRSARELCALFIHQKRTKEATELATDAEEAELQTLENVLACTSEEQRLHYLDEPMWHTSLLANLGAADALCTMQLRRKALVLDSLLEDRAVAAAAGADSEAGRKLGELTEVRFQLRQKLADPGDGSVESNRRRQAEIGDLKAKIVSLEAALARYQAGLGSSRRALQTTTAEVQAALPEHSALVEWLTYEGLGASGDGEHCYGAIVLPAHGPPRWVPLGLRSEVDKACRVYLDCASGGRDERTLAATLIRLHAAVWQPVEAALPPGTSRVILSPEGALNVLSFATLLDRPDGAFLAERFDFSYVGSGRDLLHGPTGKAGEGLVVFANPDFSSASVAPPKSASGGQRGRIPAGAIPGLAGPFPKLDKTKIEFEKLKTIAEAQRWTLQPHLGSDASKAALTTVRSPRILHLATHGFFLPDAAPAHQSTLNPGADGSQLATTFQNPMYRSGLALAGANVTLAARREGKPGPPPESDGLVTAEEVAALRLQGTELVVLSACETGRGDLVAGEGVLGLRRGFAQAGAEKLLLSLWRIGDESAAEIIPKFYQRWIETGDAALALSRVQRDELVARRKNAGAKDPIKTAVSAAGPFILSTRALKPVFAPSAER